jgi:hypothetical protein
MSINVRLYRVSTITLHNFSDVLKIGKCFPFQVLRVPCVLQEFKFPNKFLGHFTGDSWGEPKVIK